jgi:hypothetical protein
MTSWSQGFRPGPISEMEEAVYQFFYMIAAGYVDGPISPPQNPMVSAKAPR